MNIASKSLLISCPNPATLYQQMKESATLDDVIRKNLEGLGYGE